MGHSAEDEGQTSEDRKEERLQPRGEEGGEENVETDTSINNHTTVSEVRSSDDEEAQGNKDTTNSNNNNTSEQTNEKSVNIEEGKKKEQGPSQSGPGAVTHTNTHSLSCDLIRLFFLINY